LREGGEASKKSVLKGHSGDRRGNEALTDETRAVSKVSVCVFVPVCVWWGGAEGVAAHWAPLARLATSDDVTAGCVDISGKGPAKTNR
jgi:hypothetical protein